jgi:hypothetical protein
MPSLTPVTTETLGMEGCKPVVVAGDLIPPLHGVHPNTVHSNGLVAREPSGHEPTQVQVVALKAGGWWRGLE